MTEPRPNCDKSSQPTDEEEFCAKERSSTCCACLQGCKKSSIDQRPDIADSTATDAQIGRMVWGR